MKVFNKKDFLEISFNAQLSNESYLNKKEIVNKYKENIICCTENEKYNIQYFVLKNIIANTINVVIRGTENLENILTDIQYLFRDKDETLGIYIHNGFYHAAKALFKSLIKVLCNFDNWNIILTGHSMAYALCTIQAMYLNKYGFKSIKVIGFGTPKVTDKKGCEAFKHLNILRINNVKDPIQYFPCKTPLLWLSKLFGNGYYYNLGEEIEINENGTFKYIEYEKQENKELISLAKNVKMFNNIKEHKIEKYIENINLINRNLE